MDTLLKIGIIIVVVILASIFLRIFTKIIARTFYEEKRINEEKEKHDGRKDSSRDQKGKASK